MLLASVKTARVSLPHRPESNRRSFDADGAETSQDSPTELANHLMLKPKRPRGNQPHGVTNRRTYVIDYSALGVARIPDRTTGLLPAIQLCQPIPAHAGGSKIAEISDSPKRSLQT